MLRLKQSLIRSKPSPNGRAMSNNAMQPTPNQRASRHSRQQGAVDAGRWATFTDVKRIAIALIGGIVLVFGLPICVALLTYRRSEAIISTLLYWPWSVSDRLGFTDCANANSISHKLTCAYTGLFIDGLFYPLAICVCSYALHRILFRRGRKLRSSAAA